MAEDPRVQEAINVVAAEVLRTIVDNEIGNAWGDHFPEIGEHDWQRIQTKVIELANGGTYLTDYYLAAYEFLTQRAEGEES